MEPWFWKDILHNQKARSNGVWGQVQVSVVNELECKGWSQGSCAFVAHTVDR